jgi:hypothetical protein
VEAIAAASKALRDQLDKLEARINGYAEKGAYFAGISAQIKDARDQVQAGKLVDAQATYGAAVAATLRAEASLQAEPMAWKLLGLEAGYMALIFALGYLVIRYPDYWLWVGLIGLNAKAAWFGAIGGVTIGIYGIYSHIAAKDFDASYRLWYICKPVVGAIFGWFVVLIYYVGLVSAQGQADVKTPQVTYAIAFLAGFSERFTIKTIDRLMTVLTAGDDKNKAKDKGKDKPGGGLPDF